MVYIAYIPSVNQKLRESLIELLMFSFKCFYIYSFVCGEVRHTPDGMRVESGDHLLELITTLLP